MVGFEPRQRSASLVDMVLGIAVLVSVVVVPHGIDAAKRAVKVSREVVALAREFAYLAEENERLEALKAFLKCDKGKVMIARGRRGYVPEGAVVVVIDEPLPEAPPRPHGLRAVFDEMSERVVELRRVFRAALILLRDGRDPDFPWGPRAH